MRKRLYRFGPAAPEEPIVFGAAGPGAQPQDWLRFMQAQGIRRVCRLAARSPDIYATTFGVDRVCVAPIADFRVVDRVLLQDVILPFLQAADQAQEPVVVHCGGGIGRTGQVLVTWLIVGRGYAVPDAIATVKQQGRNPYEAAIAAPFFGRNPGAVRAELDALWAALVMSKDQLHG
jgi:Dual specificity phosphatase, catalytic domain